jgi:hypothetical protein
MAMLAFSHFEKLKNQFQLIRQIMLDLTLDTHNFYFFW